jgi:nucleoside 2-deoxyribosyltransferase
MNRRIYLASSWRNPEQPALVEQLRAAGHEVYDFRNPKPGNDGFRWTEVDANWLSWTPESYVPKLQHPIAQAGFALDKAALDWCDTCVLLLPCGRSAHLEAGYAAGQGKRVLFLLRADKFEPELMYLLGAGIVCSVPDLLAGLAAPWPNRLDIAA